MKIITETELRQLYKKETFSEYRLKYPEKLTPAATQFLNDYKIKIVNVKSIEKTDDKGVKDGYVIRKSGKTIDKKPEEYTQIKGNVLVLKNDKRIVFRGKLDTLEAIFINSIIEIKNSGFTGLCEDLEIILDFIRSILRAEVLEESLGCFDYKGLDEATIREYSHHPEKYLNTSHFMPETKYGKIMGILNYIRTQIRETEIASVDAFIDSKGENVTRKDIVIALNRLSSLIYVIMCQYKAGYYKSMQ